MADRKRPSLPTPAFYDSPESQEYLTPDEFIIPATGEDGGSVRCQFRCSSQLHAWMSEIASSRKFPFRRDGDLMRWALYLGCRTLARIEPNVKSMQAAIDAANQTVRWEELRAEVSDHIDKLAACVEKLAKEHAWGRIVWMISDDRRNAQAQMEVDSYWGTRWLEALDERLGDIERRAAAKLETVSFTVRRKPALGDGNGNGAA